MVFTGAHQPFVPQSFPIPTRLGPGEVLVRLSLASICGSDLHTYFGRRQEPEPSILGHEGVGLVLALGPDREDDIAVGDRVTWSLVDSCGHCAYCTTHRLPQKCPDMFKYGHAEWHPGVPPNGCYATHIVLRAGTHVVRVPDNVPDRLVVAANCALATMVHAVEHVPTDCQRIWVQGAGLLGVFGVALLREISQAEIVISETNPARLAIAQKLGAVGLTPADMTARLAAEPESFDVVIEVAGHKTLLPEGVAALRHGGLYLWVGLAHPHSEIAFKAERIVRKCLHVQGVYNYAPWHLDEGVAFLARVGATLPIAEMFSAPMPLTQLDAAIRLAAEQAWLRVILDCYVTAPTTTP